MNKLKKIGIGLVIAIGDQFDERTMEIQKDIDVKTGN